MRSSVCRLIISGLSSFFVLAFALRPHAAEPPVQSTANSPTGPEHPTLRTKIIVSKETTYVLGPLREDGLPDFNAALNELAGKGVTAENNAAVLFWKAIGSEPMRERQQEMYKLLGMAPLPADGDYLIPLNDFAWWHGNRVKPQARDASATRLQTELDSQSHKAFDHPWTKKEFPLLADWLDANQKALKLVSEGSRRPRFFSPEFPFPIKKLDDILTTRPAPNLNFGIGDALWALELRAMFHLASDDVDRAVDDALTCHCLARLYGSGPAVNDTLLAASYDSHAAAVVNRIAEFGKVSAAQNARYQRELDAPAPLEISEPTGSGERILRLGAICDIRDDPRNKIMNMLAPFPELMLRSTFDEAKALSELAATSAVDWNVVLRITNAYFDRLSKAVAKPNYRDRRADLAELDKWVASLPGLTAAKAKTPGKPTTADASEAIGGLLVKQLNRSQERIVEEDARRQTVLAASKLCMALAAFRTDHRGNYPTTLDDLVPRYVAAIPTDPYDTAQPLHYRLESKGILLYSVGPNGKDDEGREMWSRPEGDDIPIRLPHEPVDR